MVQHRVPARGSVDVAAFAVNICAGASVAAFRQMASIELETDVSLKSLCMFPCDGSSLPHKFHGLLFCLEPCQRKDLLVLPWPISGQ